MWRGGEGGEEGEEGERKQVRCGGKKGRGGGEEGRENMLMKRIPYLCNN